VTDILVRVKRVLTAEEGTTLVGERIPDNLTPSFNSPKVGDVLRIVDKDSDELLALVTRLATDVGHALRRVATKVDLSGTAGRASSKLDNGGSARTFGWTPKRPMIKREACSPSWLAAQQPEQNLFLSRLGGTLGAEFRDLAPDIAEHDIDVLRQIKSGWLMDEQALWTSGVINRSSQLPYHRDSTNFPTWSAMPTLRYKMSGGHLHLPEYDIVLPCGDGDVSWFCGKEFVHGVTPMRTKSVDAYRFSVVYYALRGMKDCATVAEETAESASRRTAREHRMADDARSRLNAERV